jgi:hypothetical protein
MGTYKGIVLSYGIGKTAKLGMPQFIVSVALTDYYDPKEGEWFDVSENHWSVNAYLALYGRKDSAEDGEIAETLNHQQVCKVFDWDGCGFEYLTTPGRFADKIIQIRISENTYENAKCPIQIDWIDTEDADPVAGLQVLDSGQVKALETEFAHLWKAKKKVAAASAPKKKAPEPEPEPPAESKEDKKKALLEKSKRLRKEAATEPPAKGKAKTDPPAKEGEESPVPKNYGKKQAWNDIIDLRAEECTDEQQKSAWDAAIAETAPDGDEDKLDAAGWWAVKEQVVGEIGQF